jgi:uncharacterized protein with HEPN domain
MTRADSLRARDYLEHIIEAIDRINRYVDGTSEDDFLDDEKTQDAVVRNFEIIGEASRNMVRNHPDFTQVHPEVPWGIAYEMRNSLAHGYFSVDFEIVWNTVKNDLPKMAELVGQLLKTM